MPTKKKLPPKKKVVKKKVQPKKKSFVPKEIDEQLKAVESGNTLLSKFANDPAYVRYDLNLGFILDGSNTLYMKAMKAIPKTKFTVTKPLLQGLERLKRILALREALISSSETGNPMPLWVELVRTVKWLKNKNK